MAIDCKALLGLLVEQKKISKKKFAEYQDDDDALRSDVAGGQLVVTLSWDGDFPGNSGAIWVSKWKGYISFKHAFHGDRHINEISCGSDERLRKFTNISYWVRVHSRAP